MVVADNHSYVIQPRPQHPDEVIVWEMDDRTLPNGMADGRGEQRTSMHCCTLHPASPPPYTSTFHFVSLVTLHLDSIPNSIPSSHLMHSSHTPITNPTPSPSPDTILTHSPSPHTIFTHSPFPQTRPTSLPLPYAHCPSYSRCAVPCPHTSTGW